MATAIRGARLNKAEHLIIVVENIHRVMAELALKEKLKPTSAACQHIPWLGHISPDAAKEDIVFIVDVHTSAASSLTSSSADAEPFLFASVWIHCAERDHRLVGLCVQ
jgi:hypothetical protein